MNVTHPLEHLRTNTTATGQHHGFTPTSFFTPNYYHPSYPRVTNSPRLSPSMSWVVAPLVARGLDRRRCLILIDGLNERYCLRLPILSIQLFGRRISGPQQPHPISRTSRSIIDYIETSYRPQHTSVISHALTPSHRRIFRPLTFCITHRTFSPSSRPTPPSSLSRLAWPGNKLGRSRLSSGHVSIP